jgi:hypothetical protein
MASASLALLRRFDSSAVLADTSLVTSMEVCWLTVGDFSFLTGRDSATLELVDSW